VSAVAGVLDGFRVIDLGSFITAPFAAMLLGDLGAEVVKVERPEGGDPFRSFERGLYGPQFKAFNRNKKSLALDLKKPGDLRLLEELIRRSDALIENYRPGVTARFGLDAARAAALNPKLVYCSITGFGPDGPASGLAAYDTVAQAASGFLSLYVAPGDTTIKGPATADVVTGLYAAYGVLGALLARERTGRGKLVEVPMMAAVAHFASEPFQHYFARGTPPAPAHRSQISQSFAFECADGKLVAVHLSSPAKFWDGLVAATGRHDLAADPRFAGRMDRVANYGPLERELAVTFRGKPRAAWLEALAAHDVPHAAVLGLDEVVDAPQSRHIGLERRAVHPQEGEVRSIRNPIGFDGAAPADFAPPPTLDEQGDALRAWLARPEGQRTKPK